MTIQRSSLLHPNQSVASTATDGLPSRFAWARYFIRINQSLQPALTARPRGRSSRLATSSESISRFNHQPRPSASRHGTGLATSSESISRSNRLRKWKNPESINSLLHPNQSVASTLFMALIIAIVGLLATSSESISRFNAEIACPTLHDWQALATSSESISRFNPAVATRYCHIA